MRSENRTQVSMFDVLYRHKNVAFSKCQNLMNEQRVKDKATGVFSVMVDLGSPVTRFRFYHRKKKTNGDGHEHIGNKHR